MLDLNIWTQIFLILKLRRTHQNEVFILLICNIISVIGSWYISLAQNIRVLKYQCIIYNLKRKSFSILNLVNEHIKFVNFFFFHFFILLKKRDVIYRSLWLKNKFWYHSSSSSSSPISSSFRSLISFISSSSILGSSILPQVPFPPPPPFFGKPLYPHLLFDFIYWFVF